jgi:hypothetical protein
VRIKRKASIKEISALFKELIFKDAFFDIQVMAYWILTKFFQVRDCYPA